MDLNIFSAYLPMAYISEATWISPASLRRFVAILNLANLSFHSGHLARASKLIGSGGLNLGRLTGPDSDSSL